LVVGATVGGVVAIVIVAAIGRWVRNRKAAGTAGGKLTMAPSGEDADLASPRPVSSRAVAAAPPVDGGSPFGAGVVNPMLMAATSHTGRMVPQASMRAQFTPMQGSRV
jgi:hypothetical protein